MAGVSVSRSAHSRIGAEPARDLATLAPLHYRGAGIRAIVDPEGSQPPSMSNGLSRPGDYRVRVRAGVVSLFAGSAILGAKWFAYRLTLSSAILSDALESIVNVVAAAFALGGLVWGGRPADRNHPYGHGKIENLSAAFEGGLVTFAAGAILYEAAMSWIEGAPLREVDRGLLLTLGAGLANALLGVFLREAGRRTRSLALVADGEHVLSDFWTSVGVVAGLLLVKLTGVRAIDHVVAILVAAFLARTGVRVIGRAAGGLLDQEDRGLLDRLASALEKERAPGVIAVHHLRAIQGGRFVHFDAHFVVPEFWAVERAHDVVDSVSLRSLEGAGIEGEIDFHVDPCRREFCAECDLADCPVRAETFRSRVPITLDGAAKPLAARGPAPARGPDARE